MTFDLKVFCAVIVFELLLTAGLALADDRPGYSGVQNPLYTNPNTIMLLGDAKATIQNLREALN